MKEALSIYAVTAVFLLVLPIASQSHAQHSEGVSIAEITPEEKEAIEESSDEIIEISSPSGDIDENIEEEVNYTLPYPGMLPDHPLYFLKNIRDTIVGILISDPLKKSEFHLLNADKMMSSAQILADNDKDSKVAGTVTSANEHMAESLSELKKAKTQKKDYGGLRDKISTSLKKHHEVIDNLQANLEDEASEEMSKYEKFLNASEQEITKLK